VDSANRGRHPTTWEEVIVQTLTIFLATFAGWTCGQKTDGPPKLDVDQPPELKK
jgi:hypothetical protein